MEWGTLGEWAGAAVAGAALMLGYLRLSRRPVDDGLEVRIDSAAHGNGCISFWLHLRAPPDARAAVETLEIVTPRKCVVKPLGPKMPVPLSYNHPWWGDAKPVVQAGIGAADGGKAGRWFSARCEVWDSSAAKAKRNSPTMDIKLSIRANISVTRRSTKRITTKVTALARPSKANSQE